MNTHQENTPCFIEVWDSKKADTVLMKGTILSTCTALDKPYRVNVQREDGVIYRECAPECIHPIGEWINKFVKDYEENEELNLHSENIVLLATHLGTKEQLNEAIWIQKAHEYKGYMTSKLMKERDALHKQLYPIFKKIKQANQ